MDKSKVIILCKLSEAAYTKKFDKLNDIETGLTLHSQFQDKGTSTEGFISVNSTTKSIYVAFKGTEEVKDFLIDADVLMAPLHGYSSKVLVHVGFQDGISSVLGTLNAFPWDSFPDYDVYFTGHSLGGALATLACMLVKISCAPHIATFGSPRVGNKDFVVTFNNLTKESIRVVHADDIVPQVPKGDYEHVDSRIHLDDNGNVVGTFNVIKRLVYWFKGKASLKIFSLDDHHISKYMEAVTKWAAK